MLTWFIASVSHGTVSYTHLDVYKRQILNPAPAQTLSATLLRHLYMITPNETEAEMISGVKITDEVSAKKAAQVIMEMGVQNVIVTLGSKGALIYCDSMVDMVPRCV